MSSYLTDAELRAEQKASGHFVDSVCVKCNAPYYVNTRYPQVKCSALVEHQYCTGEVVPLTKCRKCSATMQTGKAIVNKMTGKPDFIGGEVCTVSPDPRQPVLVDCLKCTACGYSISAPHLHFDEKFALAGGDY